MIRYAFIAIALVATQAHAADKLTIQQSLTVLGGLRNLDGHQIVVNNQVVFQPWEFGSATLRLKLANDITILTAVETKQEAIRKSIILEISKDKPKDFAIAPATPEMDEFMRQYNDLLAQPADGTQDLARIGAAELKLDKNEIPSGTLAALKPILDQ
jgi:hypothetical protein